MSRSIPSARTMGALGAGLAAGLVLVPVAAGAQDGDTTDDTTTTVVEAPDWARDMLDELVTEGVISQAQADAVEEAFVEAAPHRHHRGGPFGRHLAGAEVAELLGLTGEELREQLVPGTTLAEVAEANGVSTDELVDALVTFGEERLAQAVENGRLTQEEADAKAADLESEITERVTSELPERPERGDGPRGRFGRGGPDTSDGELEESGLAA